jgi:hypothetical protein
MPNTHLSRLVSRLGDHRRRTDLLQVLSFPGLSVDNTPTVPGLTGSDASGAPGTVDQQVSSLSTQLDNLKALQQAHLAALTGIQGFVGNGSSSSGRMATGTSGTSLAASLLSASGISPIITGLLNLFGGTNTQTAQPLVPFTLPPSVHYAGALQASGNVTPVDYGQNGMARPLGSGGSSQQSVQVQVNAIDSKSFLDHSEEIAQAVRQALLNSSNLKDVIADL